VTSFAPDITLYCVKADYALSYSTVAWAPNVQDTIVIFKRVSVLCRSLSSQAASRVLAFSRARWLLLCRLCSQGRLDSVTGEPRNPEDRLLVGVAEDASRGEFLVGLPGTSRIAFG
jgi:hypothetical protein